MIASKRPASPLALITGASGGIGSAIARELADAGYRLIIHGNKNAEALGALHDELLKRGAQATPVLCELSEPDSVESMFRELRPLGPISFLINNAGADHYGLAQDTSYEDWKRLFAVNVDSVYLCTKACLPSMISEKWGRVINISSMWGIVGAATESLYSATKGAVLAYTKSLAKELVYSGINVNAVAPGAVDTHMMDMLSEETREAVLEEIPIGRLLRPEEVAACVRFLSEPSGDAMTGQVLSPNGGMVIY